MKNIRIKKKLNWHFILYFLSLSKAFKGVSGGLELCLKEKHY